MDNNADVADAATTAHAAMQTIYQDARHQVSLAYPGEAGRVIDRLSVDAFTDALDDRDLRIRILVEEPKTLDEAVNIGLRLEALRPSGKTAQPTLPPVIDGYGCEAAGAPAAPPPDDEGDDEKKDDDDDDDNGYIGYDDDIRLELYDGTTPVELHLSRFEDFSKTFKWTEEQRAFALANSLARMACSVLWVDNA